MALKVKWNKNRPSKALSLFVAKVQAGAGLQFFLSKIKEMKEFGKRRRL